MHVANNTVNYMINDCGTSSVYDAEGDTFRKTDFASTARRAIHLVDPNHGPEPGFVQHYGLVIFCVSHFVKYSTLWQ